MKPYSIFLVEDHAGFANALNNMLSQNQNLKIVAVAGTAEEAFAVADLPDRPRRSRALSELRRQALRPRARTPRLAIAHRQ